MNKVKKKLSSRSGFTLTELLLAVAIMGILFSAIVAGVSSAAHIYRRSVALSDSQTLSSTLSNAVANELRYARNIRVTDGKVSFDSDVFGAGVSIGDSSPAGRVMVGTASRQYALLSDSAYTSGLSASATVTDYTDGVFTVEIRVSAAELAERSTVLNIRALNPQ